MSMRLTDTEVGGGKALEMNMRMNMHMKLTEGSHNAAAVTSNSPPFGSPEPNTKTVGFSSASPTHRYIVNSADGGNTGNKQLKAGEPLIEHDVDAVDLNFGCPQAIARKGRYGAFLLEEPGVPVSLVETLASELSVPVTAKLRILPASLPFHLCLSSFELAEFATEPFQLRHICCHWSWHCEAFWL